MACVVRGCKSRVRTKEPNNISFHRFPKFSSPVREEWLNVVCRMQRDLHWAPRKSSRLCSKHFSADSFIIKGDKRVYLKENAIPKTMLPSTAEIADTNCSPDDDARPLRVNESEIELVPPATSTTAAAAHILIVKTESLSDRVVEPETVPPATATSALPHRIKVKTAPLTYRALKPKMVPPAAPVTTALPHRLNIKTLPLANRVSPAATVTTELPHRLNIKTVPLSNRVLKPIMVSRAATVTTALPHRLDIKTAPLSNRILKPILVPPVTTVTTALPDTLNVEETVPSQNRVYEPKMVSPTTTVTTALPRRLNVKTVPLSRPVQKPKMILPVTAVTAALPDPLNVEETLPLLNHVYEPEMGLTTTPTHNDNTEPGSNNQLLQIIEKLERNVSRLQKLATKRLLKINSLKQRVRRLEKKVKDT